MSNSPQTPLDQFLYKDVANSGGLLPTRPAVRFLGAVSCADNEANGTTDVTVSAPAGQQTTPVINGPNHDVATNGLATLRLGGPTAPFSTGGFAPVSAGAWAAGQALEVINTTGQLWTIPDEDSGSTPTNRIATGTGVAYTIAPYGTARFIYDGTINRLRLKDVGATQPRVFDVRDFGADPIAVADNSVPINAAAAAALAANGILGMPAGANYPIEAQVQISCQCECEGATLTTAGALNSGACVALLVGSRSSALNNIRMKLPDVVDGSKTSPGWSASLRVGIELANLTASKIEMGRIWSFVVGLHVTSGSSVGSQDNTFIARSIYNNKIDIRYEPLSSTDYVAENVFIGGTIGHDSAEGTQVSGTRVIQLLSLALGSCDGNYFLKSDIEGNVPEYHVECQGSENEFVGCRWETNVGGGIYPKVYFNTIGGVDAARNAIRGGFGSDYIVFTGDGLDNVLFGTQGMKIPHSHPDGSIIASNENSNASPVLTIMGSGFLTSGANTSTAWYAQLSAAGFAWKDTANGYPRIQWSNGFYGLKFGPGSAAPSIFVGMDPNTGWGKFDGGALNTMIASAGGHVGFFDVGPTAQQTRVGQLTDATSGTPATTIVDVTTGGLADPAKCDNNFASLLAKLNAIDNILHNFGLTA